MVIYQESGRRLKGKAYFKQSFKGPKSQKQHALLETKNSSVRQNIVHTDDIKKENSKERTQRRKWEPSHQQLCCHVKKHIFYSEDNKDSYITDLKQRKKITLIFTLSL